MLAAATVRRLMNDSFTAKATVTINAPPSRVWAALTTPEMMKQYFFGVDVITDWRVGGPILYRGQWQGRAFEDKGTVLKFEPGKLLVTTHWSPLSGVPDSPENYHTVSYRLSGRDGTTVVALTQDNNASAEEQADSEKNWKLILDGLKKLVEG
jgi:uncharacterized protein YndB with AHSA1/START domain